MDYFPPQDTYARWKKEVKLSKIETGEDYLKPHHLRNFLASLISDRIISFVAVFTGLLVVATNVP